MSKIDCKLPNIWVSGTITPYTKGYCTTVKKVLDNEKFTCLHPNVWVPGTKQPFKKGYCAEPNLKITKTKTPVKAKSPVKVKTPSPVKAKTPSPVKAKTPSPVKVKTPITDILKPQLQYTSKTPKETNDAIDFVLDKKNRSKLEECVSIFNNKCDIEIAKYIKLLDTMFHYIPKLTSSITVYKNTNKYINTDFSSLLFTNAHIEKPSVKTHQLCITLPVGTKLVPYKGDIILPRDSLFDFVKCDKGDKDTSISYLNLRLPQTLPIKNVPLEAQVKFMDTLNQDEKKAIQFVKIFANKSLVKNALNNKVVPDKKVAQILNTVDTIFTKVPKLTEDIVVIYNPNKQKIPAGVKKAQLYYYKSLYLDLDKGNGIQVTIPKGSHVLPIIKKGKIIVPRNSTIVMTDNLKGNLVIDKLPIYGEQATYDFQPQISFFNGIQQSFKDAFKRVNGDPTYNLMLENDTLGTGSYQDQLDVNFVDKIFISIPPLTMDLDVMYYHDDTSPFKSFVKSYRKANILPGTNYPKNYYKITIPKGSKIIYMPTSKTVFFPRNSNFKMIEPKHYEYEIPSKLPVFTLTKEAPVQKSPHPKPPTKPSKPPTKQPQKTSHKEHHPDSAIYIDTDYTKLLQPQLEYMKKLNAKTIKALQFYTGCGYVSINSNLNHGKQPNPKTAEYINLIDELFKKIPPTTQTFVVYRGIKLKTKIEQDFISKSYVSTSSNKNISLGFGGNKNHKCCFFEITIPKGSRILPVMPLSLHSHEMEILLSRESEFHIIKHSFTPKENTVITRYIEKLESIKPFKVEAPPPKVSKAQDVGNKTCPPNTKSEPEKYICNPSTGKWVLKTGDIGKKLLKNQGI